MAKYVKDRPLLYRQLLYFVSSGYANMQQAAESVYQEFGIPLRTGDWVEDLRGHIPDIEFNFLLVARNTGKLEEGLKNLEQHTEQMEKTKKSFISKLMFPVIELVFGIGIFLFIIAYVVPRFAQLVEGIGGELPGISKVIFSIGNFMWNYLVLWLVGLIIIGIFVAKNWVRILGAIPIARKISTLYEKVVFFLSMNFFYSSGFNVVQSIQNIQLNLRFLDLQEMKKALTAGKSLTEAMSHILSPSERRFIETGEVTGKLSEVFPLLAESNQDRLFRTLEHVSDVVAPAITVVLGVMVFFILLSMYLPLIKAAVSV